MPDEAQSRRGDEIVVCGRLFHTGAPVVLWSDPGGYDAYRTDKLFDTDHAQSDSVDGTRSSTVCYGVRRGRPGNNGRIEADSGSWDLPALQQQIDQFVIHYDAAGTSRQCFKILHDIRGLSVHFMIDLDGTIYQTLDLKERAWHATKANDRSVGVEIANIGAYRPDKISVLDRWYVHDASGTRVAFPHWLVQPGIRTHGFVARPARAEPISGVVQGQQLVQYDLTDAQYDSLIKLTAALCRVFPRLRCDYPKDHRGRLINHVLSDGAYDAYSGVLGHYHVQENKVDPGPAFDWDRLIDGARSMQQAGFPFSQQY